MGMTTRGSDSFSWGVRWETIEQHDGQPLAGGLLPEVYATLGDAQREQQRLTSTQSVLADPSGWGEPQPVRYVLFARRPEDE
jgi:hypothetical protein